MIGFAPLLPGWALLLGGGAILLALLFTAFRSARTLWPRLVVALILSVVALNPVTREEVREASDDVALLLRDRTDSMSVDDRQEVAERAVTALQAEREGIEWQVVDVPGEAGEATALGAALNDAMASIPSGRLGAVFVVSDGISSDEPPPGLLPADVPLHLLLAGDRDLIDRRLIVERVPPYSVTGETAELTIRIEDSSAERVEVDIRTSAGTDQQRIVATNESVTVNIPIERRGPLDVALSVGAAEGETNLVNNRALARLNGVTDRLSVLLVSGVPYPGGRVWRDLFKSDPNVDLVHFTILRLPSSFDQTPPDQLALIPFPVEELFQERLGDFDLIIFDRFTLTQLMSPLYFQNLADRVRQGGGLLVVAGPEYAERSSVAFTDLRRILPAVPAGAGKRTPFRPALTETGRRHPVTRSLPESWGGTDWGRWSMIAELASVEGNVLMEGPEERPLLILNRVGDGRVGLIGSTDIWWWARAVDGAGPRDELLRRTAHWLMQEPDLEEEQLAVSGGEQSLNIDSQSMGNVSEAVVRGPDGGEASVPLNAGRSGSSTTVPAAQPGLYEVISGERRRFALVGGVEELAEIRPRAKPLDASATASGGGVYWLDEGMPGIRRVDAGDDAAGSDWAGVARRGGGALVAVETRSLIPAWAALIALASLLAFSWWRERR